jgi:hypothetical protein
VVTVTNLPIDFLKRISKRFISTRPLVKSAQEATWSFLVARNTFAQLRKALSFGEEGWFCGTLNREFSVLYLGSHRFT